MTSLPGPPRRGGVSQIRIRPPRRLRRDYFFRGAHQARALSRTASLAIHDSRGSAAKGLSRLRAKTFSWFRVFSPPVLKLYFKLWRRGLKQEPYGGEDIYQSGGDFLLDSKGNVLYAYRSRESGGSADAGNAAAGNRSRPTRVVPRCRLKNALCRFSHFDFKWASFNCTFSSGGAVQTRSAR